MTSPDSKRSTRVTAASNRLKYSTFDAPFRPANVIFLNLLLAKPRQGIKKPPSLRLRHLRPRNGGVSTQVFELRTTFARRMGTRLRPSGPPHIMPACKPRPITEALARSYPRSPCLTTISRDSMKVSTRKRRRSSSSRLKIQSSSKIASSSSKGMTA